MSAILKRFKGKGKTENTLPPQTVSSSSVEQAAGTDDGDQSDSGSSIFSGLTLTEGTETAPHLQKSHSEAGQDEQELESSGFSFLQQDHQTGKEESTCTEREPDPSTLSVILVTSSSKDKNNQPACALPDAQDPSDSASHSGFDFLGSVTKPQNLEHAKDNASDNNRDTEQLDCDASLGTLHQETSDSPIFSSVKTRDTDRLAKKKLIADTVMFGKTPGDSLDVDVSCSPVQRNSTTPPSSLKQQRVTKQSIPTSTRKKKKKGIRPGLEQSDGTFSDPLEQPDAMKCADTDTFSLSSQGSSSDITSTATSSNMMTIPPMLDSQIGEDSSVEHASKNQDVHRVVSKDSEAVNATCVENVELKASNDGDPNNRPIEEYESSYARLSGDHMSMVTTRNASDTVCQQSSFNKAVDVLPIKSIPDSNPGQSLNSYKLSDDPEVFPSKTSGVGGKYQIELSVTDKLTVLLEAIESKQDQLRSSLGVVQSEYGARIDEQLLNIQRQIEIHCCVKELRRKEAAALMEENYDLAAELTKELEEVEVEEEWKLAAKCQSILVEVVKKCNELCSCELSDQENLHVQLTQLKDEQAESLALLEKDLTSINARERIQLQSMDDKIERERGHISLDNEHLEKRNQLLQDEVSQRALEFISNKTQLQEKQKIIEEQIADLDAKLHELHNTFRKIGEQIAVEDESIKAVHEDFADEKEQIRTEMVALQNREFHLQQLVETMALYKESYQKTVLEYEKQRNSLQMVMDKSSEKLKETSNSITSLRDVPDLTQQWIKRDISQLLFPSSEFQRMIGAESVMDSKVRDATNEVLSNQSELFALQKRIADAESQLVQLLETKKVAAAARQFRQAGTIAKEEKILHGSLERMKKDAEKVSRDLDEKRKALDAVNADLISIKNNRLQLERKEDLSCIKEIVCLIKQLKHQYLSVPSHLMDLQPILKKWCVFNQQLLEGLCVKHDLVASDYLAEEDVTLADKEVPSEHPGRRSNNSEDCTDVSNPNNEAMEEDEAIKDCSKNEENRKRKKILQEKLTEIESGIKQACMEENYDLAAELDDELNRVKAQFEEAS